MKLEALATLKARSRERRRTGAAEQRLAHSGSTSCTRARCPHERRLQKGDGAIDCGAYHMAVGTTSQKAGGTEKIGESEKSSCIEWPIVASTPPNFANPALMR